MTRALCKRLLSFFSAEAVLVSKATQNRSAAHSHSPDRNRGRDKIADSGKRGNLVVQSRENGVEAKSEKVIIAPNMAFGWPSGLEAVTS
jgi:hypothetical protein